MVCDWLEVSLDEGSNTILEEKIKGIKLHTNTQLQNGIYTFDGGWLTLESNTHATIMTPPTYDIDYLRRVYRGRGLPEFNLGKTPRDPQVVVARSSFPEGFLLSIGLAREQFESSIKVGDQLEFVPYMEYNPAPEQLTPNIRYAVVGLADPSEGNPIFVVEAGDKQLRLGHAYFKIPEDKLKRNLVVAELASLGGVLSRLLSRLYRER